MPPKSKLKKGKGAKNSKRTANYDSGTTDDESTPPGRSSSRAAKKRRAAKKLADLAGDVSSTDEGPDVHEALQAMTAMMTSMSARLEGLEEGSRARRRVSFLEDLPSAEEEHVPVSEESRAANHGAHDSVRPPPPHEQPRLPTDVFTASH